MTTDTSFYLTKSKVEMVLQSNLGQENYKVLYRELYSIPPPTHGSHSMLGIKLWFLTSPMRSWMDLAWGLYRSHLDNALKQARLQIIQDEGEGSITCIYVNLHHISIFHQCISIDAFQLLIILLFPNTHVWTHFVGYLLIYFTFTIKPVVHCTCTLTIIYIDEENVVRRVEFENVLRQGRHGITLQRGKGSITTCNLYGSIYNRLCNVPSFHCQCQSITILLQDWYIHRITYYT